jgi:hypothetical protein
MTLDVLLDVVVALERGEVRAECTCGAMSADPEFCPECGALDLEVFELAGLRETLAGEFRRELARLPGRPGPDPRLWAALTPHLN